MQRKSMKRARRGRATLFESPSALTSEHEAPPPRVAPLKSTPVYDTYWRFAAERQGIFFRRLSGKAPPWTNDEILRHYKFTNAYRDSDRVSQYLIRRVIYRYDLPSDPSEVVFRVLLFKIFNRIDTWEMLERDLGQITYADFSFKRYDKLLTRAMSRGERVYSAAYIMPSGGKLGRARKLTTIIARPLSMTISVHAHISRSPSNTSPGRKMVHKLSSGR